MKDFVVSRRIHGKLEDSFFILGNHKKLKIETLGSIPNLSLNLLGGKFNSERFIKFCPKGEASSAWDGRKVSIRKYKDFIEIDNNCFSIVFRGRHLHKVPVPYKKVVKNPKEKERLKFLGFDLDKLVKEEEVNLLGNIHLEHLPTMLNYWHFVMDICPATSDNPIKDEKSAWKKNMIKFVLQEILTIKFEVAPLAIPKIPRSSYIRCFFSTKNDKC